MTKISINKTIIKHKFVEVGSKDETAIYRITFNCPKINYLAIIDEINDYGFVIKEEKEVPC